MIRRRWRPEEADSWTREDVLAMVLSPLAYVGLMVGMALSLFLQPLGFVVLGAGIGLTVLLHWIIDPKLRALSEAYDRRQAEYLDRLEALVRWEETDA